MIFVRAGDGDIQFFYDLFHAVVLIIVIVVVVVVLPGMRSGGMRKLAQDTNTNKPNSIHNITVCPLSPVSQEL